jgi:type II secretory pathway pseudopilin PulG
LIVIALIGIVAVVTVPMLRAQDPVRLDAAATEVGNALRFALREAQRSGGYLLVDVSTPGQLRLHASNASGAMLGAVNDPLTKSALDIGTPALLGSNSIAMSGTFFSGGVAYTQLLVGPAGQLRAFEAGIDRGPLQPGSGVVLTSGMLSATVAISEATGRVAIP